MKGFEGDEELMGRIVEVFLMGVGRGFDRVCAGVLGEFMIVSSMVKL